MILLGLRDIIPRQTLVLDGAQPADLKLAVEGTPNIDVYDWIANFEYAGFNENDETVQYFKLVLNPTINSIFSIS